MGIIMRLAAIIGKRAFYGFGIVTFLCAALLATVNITSRYALKLYVDKQLNRIPWDFALYQTNGYVGEDFPNKVRSMDGVDRVEAMAFLRAQMPEQGGGGITQEVDGKPITTPWLCVLAATDLSLLPPELHFALEGPQTRGISTGGPTPAVMTLIGPERSMGKAFLALQGTKQFSLNVNMGGQKRDLFSSPIQSVIRLDRNELNSWFLDQTGSISFVPSIGIVLLMPYDNSVLRKFDLVAGGMVPPELIGPGESEYGHVQTADYVPEITYLARIDRAKLISAWDLESSIDRLAALTDKIKQASMGNAPPGLPDNLRQPSPGKLDYFPYGTIGLVVDSTTRVLLERMNRIAKLIGLITFVIALPLLWIAWVLAANLSRLLMLNERRTLGLMRLRGVPGRYLGRAFLLSIMSGGFIGGILGVLAGSIVPLLIYEHGSLPLDVLEQPEQLLMFLAFFVVTLALALVVSRRLVKFATTISPLEASGRVAGSEAAQASVKFGVPQFLAVVLGAYTIGSWIFGYSLTSIFHKESLNTVDQILNFIGLPLFIYGIAALLVASGKLIQALLLPVLKPLAGRLGPAALSHVSVKPHRIAGFLFIVAMVACVGLYPKVTDRSFEEKEVRGARTQMGTEWQVIYNAPDFAGSETLHGGLGSQLGAIRPQIEKSVASLNKVEGIEPATYVIEALLPRFYLPGYGIRGVPLYLIGNIDDFSNKVYSEPELGINQQFLPLISKLKSGEVAVSPPIAEFWRLSQGDQLLLGADEQKNPVFANTAGVLAFLPGTPPQTVTDRQGYVQARIDYLNFLFENNAYIVASADAPQLSSLDVLVSRVVVLAKSKSGTVTPATTNRLAHASTVRPLEIHNLPEEVEKVGTDMFISLALQNLRIYLIGGLLLALIAILAVALANYTEDRRTLALLRIRGASPSHIFRFLLAMLLSPGLLGLVVGAAVALLAGYGLTNYVWRLREIKTVVHLLPAHMVLSPMLAAIAALILALLIAVVSFFSMWVFRRTANERIQEG